MYVNIYVRTGIFYQKFSQKYMLQLCCWRVWAEVGYTIQSIIIHRERKFMAHTVVFACLIAGEEINSYLQRRRAKCNILCLLVTDLVQVWTLWLRIIRVKIILLSLVLSFSSKSSVFLLKSCCNISLNPKAIINESPNAEVHHKLLHVNIGSEDNGSILNLKRL